MLENDASYSIIFSHMDPNTPRTFIGLLDGNDEIENIERSNKSVSANTHMQYHHTVPHQTILTPILAECTN